MNPGHRLTLSLSPSERERVPAGPVRGFMGAKHGLVASSLRRERGFGQLADFTARLGRQAIEVRFHKQSNGLFKPDPPCRST